MLSQQSFQKFLMDIDQFLQRFDCYLHVLLIFDDDVIRLLLYFILSGVPVLPLHHLNPLADMAQLVR
jgi:hypothetical protein